MATKRSARPVVEERVARCQEFLLAKFVELGTVEGAIQALIALAESDAKAHAWMVGRPEAKSRETYRRYWQGIPLARREEARQLRDARRRRGTGEKLTG